jgi:prepilin-type N-terminal cleavage/methylation domain-containing protein
MKKQTNAGYSLIEVLIALAITSVVLLTVVTLFYMGRRNVYSGKQMTYAVSVGTRMLEDLSSLATVDAEKAFNIDDTTTTGTVTVQGLSAAGGSSTTYTNSVGRECAAIDSTCNNDTNGYLTNWKALIDESKLTSAKVGVVFTPRSPANPTDCPNCPWTTARFLKIRAYVSWEEAKDRRRVAFFDTSKINRE